MKRKRKNSILLAITAVALLGAGLSLYLQLGSGDAPALAAPLEAAPAEVAAEEVAMEEDEGPEWEEGEPERRTGGFAFPPDYDGTLEGSEANPPADPE